MPLFQRRTIKPSVANPVQRTHDSTGVKYPRWHAKNPKNAVIVPASTAPTKG